MAFYLIISDSFKKFDKKLEKSNLISNESFVRLSKVKNNQEIENFLLKSTLQNSSEIYNF
jgi:hypothetical protein